MKTISLTKNRVTLVDEDDYEYLNQFTWYCTSSKYAARKPRSGIIYIHRLIMDCPLNLFVDHINHDTLDNRKENLRICSKRDNQRHQQKRKGVTSSKYKGVHFFKRDRLWVAQIDGAHIGRYVTENESAEAYNVEAAKLHGNFAKLNKL